MGELRNNAEILSCKGATSLAPAKVIQLFCQGWNWADQNDFKWLKSDSLEKAGGSYQGLFPQEQANTDTGQLNFQGMVSLEGR